MPLVPVLGNHEYYGDPELRAREALYGWPSTARGYYALDYGAFALLVLNSNLDRMTSAERAQQTWWLEANLRHWSKRKPVLVTYHHAAYSSSWMVMMMPRNPAFIRKHWHPLFRKYRVKLVLSGHEHLYERLSVKGVPTLVAGPAGGGHAWYRPTHSRYSIYRRRGVRTVSLVRVRASGWISVRTYDVRTGGVFDRWEF